MKNSRLVNILKTFSKKEVREFKKWLSSPAHNQREDVFLLFEHLFKNKHLEIEKYLDKKVVYRQVFPKETFDDAKIRQVIHFLFKTVEDFLIYKELLEDNVQTSIFLAKVYRKRKLDKSFQKSIKNIEKLQEADPFRNENYYRNEYILQQEKYAYQNQFKRTTSNLQAVSDALDISFIADKLRQSCLMITHQSIYKAEYNLNLITEVLSLIKDETFLEIPAIALYFYTYKTLTKPEDEAAFTHLKEGIVNLGHFFPHSEIRDIYLLAINYCIKKMNAGKDIFVREAFDLYQNGFQKSILIEEGNVSQWTFLNAVFNALRLKEFVWAEHFIQDYQDYIPEKYKEGFVHYCLARLNFEKGDYDAALKSLIYLEPSEIIINLNSKVLLLKIYYHNEDFEPMEFLLESMRTYLQRKKVMGYHKAIFKNLIRLTKKLIHLNPYDKKQQEKLKVEIMETNPMSKTDREWLLEQLDKL